MPGAIGIAGDVAASAVALAGLILVFLGAVSNSFDSYQKAEQGAVKARYQRRAWFAFTGFVLAVLAAVLGLVGKWFSNECSALSAAVLLLIAVAFALFAALFAVLEIK